MPQNQPLKLLYLVTLSEWGGAQKYVFDLASSLNNQGYTIIVAAGGDKNGPLIQKLTKLNIKVYYLKNLQRSINFYRDWLAFWDIVKLYKEIKPDIVHLNSSKAGALGALAAKCCKMKKIIYTVHGLVLNEPLSFFKRKFYWLVEWFSGLFKTHLICVSEFDKQSLLQNKITKSKKIIVIHNGIDLNNLKFFSAKEAKEKLIKLISYKLQIDPRQLTSQTHQLIGTIANFYPTKGLTYLIEAAKEVHATLPELKFIIIGDGLERRKLTELIQSYKLNATVFLAGIIPQASQYLKAFDIFVLPSVKEGLSYTLIEAQTAGLPTIATNVGGSSEIVQHNKTGLLVPAKNFDALAENIINLTNNQALQKKLSANALINSQKFSLQTMIAKVRAVYSS